MLAFAAERQARLNRRRVRESEAEITTLKREVSRQSMRAISSERQLYNAKEDGANAVLIEGRIPELRYCIQVMNL